MTFRNKGVKNMMKKIRHSKFKNTGILFELLVRQTTADIISGNNDTKALKLIKKYFSGKSELSRELELYDTLVKERFNSESKARDLIEAVIKERQKLSNQKLRHEKYNLIKEIKDTFNIEDFFKSRIQNYKIYASAFKLFESATTEKALKPAESVSTKHTIIEHIIQKPVEGKEQLPLDKTMEEYLKQGKDMRLLSYKLLVDKFNDKYKNLDVNQKQLLKEYINNVANTNSLRQYVDSEVDKVKSEIESFVLKVKDNVTAIKLKEVASQLDNLKKGQTVKDSQVVSLMRYYELVKELKNTLKEVK